MKDLTGKLLSSADGGPASAARIVRQIRHVEAAIGTEDDPAARAFLHASFQVLNWALNPDGFAPPVQMIRHWRGE